MGYTQFAQVQLAFPQSQLVFLGDDLPAEFFQPAPQKVVSFGTSGPTPTPVISASPYYLAIEKLAAAARDGEDIEEQLGALASFYDLDDYTVQIDLDEMLERALS